MQRKVSRLLERRASAPSHLMRILFDQGTPSPLRRALAGHTVEIAYGRGWSRLSNGDLLVAAEGASFDLFVTRDQNLRYQQNLAGSRLAILVLLKTRWPVIQQHNTENGFGAVRKIEFSRLQP